MIPLSMPTPWPAVAAAALIVGCGFAGGYALKGRIDAAEVERLKGDIARLEAAHADEKRRAAEAAAARLAQAEDAAREAALALEATKSKLAATQKRLKEELHALPTAGRCGLSGPARGLLNAAIAADASAMPARAAAAADAAAAAAADTGHSSSEADVGGWIAETLALYGECRARIDAIREWDEVTHGR